MVTSYNGIGDLRKLGRDLRCVREISTEEATKEIHKIFQEFGTGEPFKPVAYYDVECGAIRVFIENCSYTETERIWPITLHERNHDEDSAEKIVGFSIENAKAWCAKRNLPSQGQVSVQRILRFMTAYSMTATATADIHQLLRLLEKHSIDEFEFPA